MAHYVLADVHGEADRFQAMLEKIQFSADDALYILGNVIDRGPNGIELIPRINSSIICDAWPDKKRVTQMVR